LELMAEEINRFSNINLGNLKNIFESIIHDEEHHKELLATIKELLSPKKT
jgi:rubrerythrin